MKLLPFVMAGQNGPSQTLETLFLLESQGIERVELGVPFSEPVADGPTIQKAHESAIQHGINIKSVLELVKEYKIKNAGRLKITLFSYLNPLLSLGSLVSFEKQAEEEGVDSLLLVDCPPEYSRILSGKLGRVYLGSPTTDQKRIVELANQSNPFFYYISRCGVTGTQDELDESLVSDLNEIKRKIETPLYVGFGIQSGKQVEELKGACDGVIVGSALVKKQGNLKDYEGLIKELKSATN